MNNDYYFSQEPWFEEKKRAYFFPPIPPLNILLFLLTGISTYLWLGVWYSISLLAILLAHELGHFIACRKYGINATYPYFLPSPFLPGTFGAFIKIKDPLLNRRILFDVGIAGPFAGLIVSIPVILIGLNFSEITLHIPANGIIFGEPILFRLLKYLVFGFMRDSYDLILNEVAIAGWLGLFVTAMNLIPVGQLDGGHISYALFGKWSRIIVAIFMSLLLLMGFFLWTGWLIWAGLLFAIGLKHPPPFYDFIPLDRKRKFLGILAFVILFLCITPIPVSFVSSVKTIPI